MSDQTTLRDGLRVLAGQAPPVRVPDDFVDQVRRRTARRRATGAAALVLLFSLAVGVALQPGRAADRLDPASPAASTSTGLPQRLHVPPLWSGTVEQSRPGAAAAIFGGPATRNDWDEGRFAVVAADRNRYRVFLDALPYPAPGFESLLSPDGRLVAYQQTVHPLEAGAPDPVSLPGDALAFSPDGKLVVYETFEGTTTIDGVLRRPSQIGVYDLDRGTTIATVPNDDNTEHTPVAISADNSRLAMQFGDTVRLFQLDRAAPVAYATVRLESEVLAGPGAWLPDGGSFVTVRRDPSQTWQLISRDGRTGAERPRPTVPPVTGARYVRVLGWADGGVPIAVIGVPESAADVPPLPGAPDPGGIQFRELYTQGTTGARLVALAEGQRDPRVLLTTPDGVTDLDVAADLAASGRVREVDGPPEYGPLRPAARWALIVLVVLTAIPVAGWWIRRRLRRRAR
jgi:hypothetical protein